MDREKLEKKLYNLMLCDMEIVFTYSKNEIREAIYNLSDAELLDQIKKYESEV